MEGEARGLAAGGVLSGRGTKVGKLVRGPVAFLCVRSLRVQFTAFLDTRTQLVHKVTPRIHKPSTTKLPRSESTCGSAPVEFPHCYLASNSGTRRALCPRVLGDSVGRLARTASNLFFERRMGVQAINLVRVGNLDTGKPTLAPATRRGPAAVGSSQ